MGVCEGDEGWVVHLRPVYGRSKARDGGVVQCREGGEEQCMLSFLSSCRGVGVVTLGGRPGATRGPVP